MRLTALIVLTLSLITAAARAENKVQATLVSSSATALPGSTLEVALRFAIPDGWHLYYLNPGDTGLPPRIAWESSPGVAAGELRFPAPEVIKLPNDMVAYGYENDLTLLSTIAIDPQFDAERPIDLAGHVKWLVCSKDACIAEKQDVALKIAIGPVNPTADGRFAQWRENQPQRPTHDELPANVFIDAGGDGGIISVRMPGDFDSESEVKIFPPRVDFLTFDQPPSRHAIVGGMMVTQPFKILPGMHHDVAGVLMLTYNTAEKQQKSVEVPVTFPFDKH